MLYKDANRFHRTFRRFISTGPVAVMSSRTMHHIDRATFRLSGHRFTLGAAVSGLPVVFLETVGARTGKPRRSPLLGIPDGDNLAVTASNWGRTSNPGWYYNLLAEPAAWVTVGHKRMKVLAHEATGDEHERLWQLGQRYYPGWPKYEKRAGRRTMHIFVLEPVSPLAEPEPMVTGSESAPVS